jgi:hypothetical protein
MITSLRQSAALPDVDVKQDLFVVENGVVAVHGVIGQVTDDLTSGVGFVIAPPGVPGGTVSPSRLAVGSLLVSELFSPAKLYKGGDTFSLKVDGNDDGAIEWTVWYEQVTEGAVVTPL